MDKSQAINAFWNSFGLPAYDEQTVPDEATLPYITFNVVTDALDNKIPLNGSLWYFGTSWAEVAAKAEQIARYVGEHGHVVIKFDDGYMYVTQGSPFYQRVADASNELVRRIYINIMAEFISAY